MNADGTNQTNVSNHASKDRQASWSPDGTKIAFTTDRDGDWEIYLMDNDGSNPIRLTDSIGLDWKPIWSPDGTKIAFQSQRDGNYEV